MSKRKLVDNVDNIAAYFITYNSLDILGGRSSNLSVVERVGFIH